MIIISPFFFKYILLKIREIRTIPDSMHTFSKFDFLWILSRYDKFVISNLWENSCKAIWTLSVHSLVKQFCSKTVAIVSESACVTMVTSALALTCCKLVMNLQTYHAELAASLQTCDARFAAICCKLKLLSGKEWHFTFVEHTFKKRKRWILDIY